MLHAVSASGGRNQRLLLGTLLFLVGALLLSSLWRSVSPTFREGTYRLAGEERHFTLPLRVRSPAPGLEIRLGADLPAWHPWRYHVFVHGCLEELSVNEVQVREGVPFCDSALGRAVDLSPYLRPGHQEVALRVRNVEAPRAVHLVNMRASRTDPLLLAFTAAFLMLVVAYGVFVVSCLDLGAHARKLACLVLLGVVVRVLYVSATPHVIRAYDWPGHLEYLRYVAEHLRLPPAQFGSETYQPPLYYALAALVANTDVLLGRSFEWILDDLQVGSLLLSLVTLVAGLIVGGILFSGRRQRNEHLIFAGVLATFPGLVSFASRLSNDVLYQLVAFLFLVVLLRWWRSGQAWDWGLLSVAMGAGLLTKSNALLLLPIALLCLVLRRGESWKRKLRFLTLALVIVAILAGWFLVLRFAIEGEASIVGNIQRIDQGQRVGTSLKHLLLFHPLRILRFPYNDSWEEAAGRAYFLEYLFRSAYFGGFSYGPRMLGIASLLLIAGMVLLPMMVWGLWQDLRRPQQYSIPLLLTTAVSFAGHVAYRVIYPLSINQDFRFSVLLVLPLTYYLVRGIQSFRGPLRDLAWSAAILHVTLSAAFVVTLYAYS